MPSRVPVALLVLLSTFSGCARFEYVAPDCGPSVLDSGHSQIAWQHAGPPGRISGRIVELPDGTPLHEAQIRVQGRDFQSVDASGAVSVENVSQGTDTLVIRALNHSMASTVLDLRGDTGIVFIAVMEPRRVAMDGCGSVLAQRRKPWWKVL